MGSAISSISNAIGNNRNNSMDNFYSGLTRNPGQQISGIQDAGGTLKDSKSLGGVLSAAGNMANATGGLPVGDTLKGLGTAIDGSPGSVPTAPGIDPSVAQTLKSQQDQATQFRANLPDMQNQAYQGLAQKANQQMGQNIAGINSYNNRRGLLYGGLNEGMKQNERANTQVGLAAGRASINDQYADAANKMDAAALQTGLAVQQSQQSIQDQIYNQALINMQNQSQGVGSAVGSGLMLAAMFA